MKRDRSRVTAVQTTRYYIFGRGYNSSLAAHMQIAKRYVDWLCERDSKPSRGLAFGEYLKVEDEWYRNRYPVREGCPCYFCFTKGEGKRSNARPGCFFAKMADYRLIAREIISGERDHKGVPLAESVYGIPALPARREVAS